MAYTEIQEKGNKKNYYRAYSIRKGQKVKKKRIYLGSNLAKEDLVIKEKEADFELLVSRGLLTKEEIAFLEGIKKQYSLQPRETNENRYEFFCSLFTFDSTTIEGNTLTLQETTRLLFEGVTPNKPMREVYEVLNHKRAFDYLLNYTGEINKEFICELHKLVVANTLSSELVKQIGIYRNVQVYIRGVQWFPPKPLEVHQHMDSLVKWYSKNKNTLHPLILCGHFHTEFEKIHPFVDGNGRVGRLLMNFILHRAKYPMINISNKIKHTYYSALESAQMKGNLRPFLKLLLDVLKKEGIRF